ncbi:MAG: PEGA domain-containing protein [Pseudomonadales bacterium]|nr:PEGA domain-containing protein [Pseudomonadales bacterium]
MRLFLALLVLLSTACTSSTVIRSSDPDARIYVNGEYIGTGRAHYSDEKVAFSRNDVEIRREGCRAEHYSFRRSEEADLGAIIGGILFTVPYLWVTEYKDYHAYEYDCEPSNI